VIGELGGRGSYGGEFGRSSSWGKGMGSLGRRGAWSRGLGRRGTGSRELGGRGTRWNGMQDLISQTLTNPNNNPKSNPTTEVVGGVSANVRSGGYWSECRLSQPI